MSSASSGAGVTDHDDHALTPEQPISPFESGRQASSASGSGLAFITISNPTEAKDSDVRFLVRSHAQRNYHAKRKWRFTDIPDPVITHLGESSGRLTHYEGPGASGLTSWLPAQQWSHCPYCNLIGGLHQCRGSVVSYHTVNPSPKGPLGAGKVDPFSSYPRPVSHHEHLLLDYFVNHFCPKNDPVYPPEFSNALSTIWLPRALKDMGMLDGMLLITARDMMTVLPNERLQTLILQLRSKLIRDVNIAVSDEWQAVQDESIATLLQLAFDEVVTGNWKALESHVKALKLILRSRGELPTAGFQGFLGFLVARMDLISSLHKRPESLAPAAKPSHPISVENHKGGFLAQGVMENLSRSMIIMLDYLSALSESIETHPAAALPPVGAFSTETESTHFEHNLHQPGGPEEKEILLAAEPDIEGCMICAVAIYRSRILHETDIVPPDLAPSSSGTTDTAMARFRAGMSRLFCSTQRLRYLPLLLWMAFMGSLSTTGERIDDAYWPQMAYNIATELRIAAWEDARRVLRTFLWLDENCEWFGRRLWAEVELIAAGASTRKS